jgi:CBS domain-containing protein
MRSRQIFTFKDMLGLVAKRVALDRTVVKDAMTANPQTVEPGATVLEALNVMHAGHYLNLPVVHAATGEVRGLMSVMDVVQSLAKMGGDGGDGGRSFWASAMDGIDNISEVGSTRSHDNDGHGHGTPHGHGHAHSHTHSRKGSVLGVGEDREKERAKPVSELRLKEPVFVDPANSVASVAKQIKGKRGVSAVLVVGNGTLLGIFTDTDLTRRVVADGRDAARTPIGDVMTRDPRTVGKDDDCLEALTLMSGHGFRHLPVLDREGVVTGVLDIAKCLHDAIKRLESRAKRAALTAPNASSSTPNAASKAQYGAAWVARTFGHNTHNADATGDGIPRVADVLDDAAPASRVTADVSVSHAAKGMKDSGKACLVVDSGRLVGILTFKDVLGRVIARDLTPADTLVGDAMTPSPETVGPEVSVLDALYKMRDGPFLNLPVVDAARNGRVVGLISVMDVVKSLSRLGGGGDDGARSFWAAAMGGDEGWDTGSEMEGGSTLSSRYPQSRATGLASMSGHRSVVSSVAMPPPAPRPGAGGGKVARSGQPVSKLKPRKAPLVFMGVTVAEAVKEMVSHLVPHSLHAPYHRGRAACNGQWGAPPVTRLTGSDSRRPVSDPPLRFRSVLLLLQLATKADAVLVTTTNGEVCGILTDNDVTRKVLSDASLDPEKLEVEEVMTKDPIMISFEDDSLEALTIMVAKGIRHLPVINPGNKELTGLLDIARCLAEALEVLKARHHDEEATGMGGKTPTQSQRIRRRLEEKAGHLPSVREVRRSHHHRIMSLGLSEARQARMSQPSQVK